MADVRSQPLKFELLYEALYDELAGYVYRRTGDRHVTEDLVADVFLSALDGLARVRDPQVPFRFWLFRIATNKVNRWWRTTRRREWLLSLVPGAGQAEESKAAGEEGEADELARTLRRLSPGHQTVLSLHYLQELSVDEIAILLACAPGTVKSRLARARAAFLACSEGSRTTTRKTPQETAQ